MATRLATEAPSLHRFFLSLALLGIGTAAWGEEPEGPAATPQRPSLSFNTATVPARGWELESGGRIEESGGSAVPLFLKYGLTDRNEFELGFDAVRRAETDSGTTSSAGDLFAGVRSRLWEEERAAVAVVGWVKAPTASDAVGSGEWDAGIVGVYSRPLGRLALDANLWLAGLGEDDGSILGQTQLVVTLGLPASGCWSPFVEVAVQDTAQRGSGGFADAGVSCAVSRRGVFDAAVGSGWSEGYPDWTVDVGWTLLLKAPR